MHIIMKAPPQRLQYLRGGYMIWPEDVKNNGFRCVYVGTPTPWANPYKVRRGNIETRAEAVAAFRKLVLSRPTLLARIRRELKGKNLACWCALDGQPCHADVLMEIANSPPPKPPEPSPEPHPCRARILGTIDDYLDGVTTREEALSCIARLLP